MDNGCGALWRSSIAPATALTRKEKSNRDHPLQTNFPLLIAISAYQITSEWPISHPESGCDCDAQRLQPRAVARIAILLVGTQCF
jgi:hypothetical protein